MIGLGVFAKPPQAGLVKTRLIPAIGADKAASVYRYCLEYTLELARHSGLDYQVYLSQGSSDAIFENEQCSLQKGDNLGARMMHALKDIHSVQGDGAIIIGTDCLDMEIEHLHSAARALASHELVLLPAVDGGYALIGCTRADPVLFERVEWSTPGVMQQTLANAEKLNYRVSLLETVRDIDTLHDLEHYPELLALIASA